MDDCKFEFFKHVLSNLSNKLLNLDLNVLLNMFGIERSQRES